MFSALQITLVSYNQQQVPDFTKRYFEILYNVFGYYSNKSPFWKERALPTL